MKRVCQREVHRLLVTVLAGLHGGDQARWSRLIGEVRLTPHRPGLRSNWIVDPAGDVGEVAAATRAIELVRGAYPIVAVV